MCPNESACLFAVVFLATKPGEPELELTWNWGGEDKEAMKPSRSFGHIAFAVDDVYAMCSKLQAAGVTINRPPRDGKSTSSCPRPVALLPSQEHCRTARAPALLTAVCGVVPQLCDSGICEIT